MISPFFFVVDEAAIHEDLHMVGDRWLCKIDYILDARTFPASPFVGEITEDPEAVDVS